MKATIEGYTFDFPNATNIRKFDDKSHHMTQAMKAVDVIIELPEWRFFIEVKNYELHKEWTERLANEESAQRLKKLRFDLVYKYRDSFLYQWCLKSKDKRNAFIFLTDWLDPVKILSFQNELKERFPTSSSQSMRKSVWSRSFVDIFLVVNKELWRECNLKNFGTIY